MKTLIKFVEQRNAFKRIFGEKELLLDNAADRQEIADIIDCALSPENLACDGELSRGQVRARYIELTTAARELQKLDPNVKFYEFS